MWKVNLILILIHIFFVNALTGNTSAWNGVIGQRVKDEGYGYLTYNFRGQINSSFDESINLTSEIVISDLLKLIQYLNLKNIILCGLSIGWFVCSYFIFGKN